MFFKLLSDFSNSFFPILTIIGSRIIRGNLHGIFISTIIVNLVQTKVVAPLVTPLCVLVREGLARETSVNGMYNRLFPNNKSSYSRNFIIANQSALLAVQSLPNNQTIVPSTSTVVQSNTFSDPYWQTSLLDPEYSKFLFS